MNVNAFIGIPYQDHGRDHGGVDCWGLVHLVYEEMRGIVLPDYRAFYGCADDQVEVSALLGMAALGRSDVAGWRPVPRSEWQPLDVLLIRMGRFACHVGLLVDGGNFLHCLKGRAAVLEPLDAFGWAPAIKGGYRWTAPT